MGVLPVFGVLKELNCSLDYNWMKVVKSFCFEWCMGFRSDIQLGKFLRDLSFSLWILGLINEFYIIMYKR